ncbi:hypothetical protein Tco_0333005 [Tanacetum coccineum]
MGELIFFLGLQVKQKEDEIFISQDKYVTEILKKFSFSDVKTASTPMETQKPLLKDEDGEKVDVHLYRSMIGSLIYLTSSRPDIILISWQCKKYTVVANSTTKAEYIAASSCCGQVLWIQNQLLDYGDSNEKKLIQMIKIHTDKNVADLLTKAFDKGIEVNAGDSKLMLLGINLLVLGKVNAARHNLLLLVATIKVKMVNGEQQLQALVDRKKMIIIEATNLDNAVKFLMYLRFVQVFLNNQLEGMITHNRIYIAPSHTKKIFANMRRKGKDFSERETPLFPTMMVQAQEEIDGAVTKEPSMQLKELMDFCTKLQQRVLDLENTKTAQAQEITSLKKRVKKLEKKGGSRTHKLKRLYKIGRSARVVSSKEASLGDQEDVSKQGRKIHDIDADEDITLENVHDAEMFDVNDLKDDEVVVESEHADKDVNLSVNKVTLAQALTALKSVKVQEKGDVIKEPSITTVATTITVVSLRPRAKEIVFHEQKQEQEQAPTPIVSSQQPTQVKDKGKGKMVEEEPVKKMFKNKILNLDEELAFKLQAKEDEEERLAREKAQKVEEANIAWIIIKLKLKLIIKKRRKHFAAKRSEEKRNRPPTKAQQRNLLGLKDFKIFLELLLLSLNSLPADNVPAGRSSSIPADYVSAGHVLVPADSDRIC